ncbi:MULTISPECIES: CYTH and CHAD domain-containing protein [unclassified Streptomyces]|uniref:CYTH and CHAD domain-containing protein n=1 Tax=unclassified Streptomyces TaxID=2593676 RepID=UPI00037EEF11|nr:MULTISPECIES: CYTH and CHAD domain-containing protein [unclassified Streptomyces]MYT32185.1 CHAD domain-containing protein [Streptomyces sp. SID8354]
MADTVREIERKYETGPDAGRLPDLTRAGRVATATERAPQDLDAVYYDTADQRLAADGVTLRRRTGGPDEGWHLKLPVALPEVTGAVRDEIRAPLSDAPPAELTALVRSRARGAALVPLVRLRTRRTVHDLRDAAGRPLAEVAVDEVRARRLHPEGAKRKTRWREIEVELAPGAGAGAGQELLDEVERVLTEAGARPAAAPSKLARALAETAPGNLPEAAARPAPEGPEAAKGADRPADTAGDVVLRYVRAQVRALVELDPAVRRDLPDAVHQMRVATRRLRSAFRSYAKVLDRAATDPLGAELQWLAAELGAGRDQEVLADRLTAALAEVPRTLRLGPVSARLRTWSVRRRAGARDRLLDALDGPRYLALLDDLHALLGAPPLRGPAARPARSVVAGAVLKDYRRLARRIETALDTPAGPARDEALHSARKAAKRTRYAAEAATPALGRPARKFTRRAKQLQQLLGDHQDSVVARAALRELATQAHGAGESGFTFGLLHGRQEALADRREQELPGLWAKVSRRRLREALRA